MSLRESLLEERKWVATGAVLIVLLLTLAAIADLSAHALLIDSVPKADASLPAPSRLVLRFNSRIEPRLSSVWLVGGPQNARVLLLMPEAPSADTLVYSLPDMLARGQYRAEWKVLSVDGHVTEGVVRFTVIENVR
jgi:methionine-rich copper-binding protein CopC